jgi:GNAT superfamily N-acetyltransferase
LFVSGGKVFAVELAQEGRIKLACLEESDCGDLLNGLFGRLSPSTVYRRFFSPVVRLEQFKASLLTTDRYEREAMVALEGGEVVGLAQYSRRVGSYQADMAVVVADDWQGQGLGVQLVAAIADRAAAEGITEFAVSIQGDNVAALRLFKRLAPGARLAFAGGVGEAVIPLGGFR